MLLEEIPDDDARIKVAAKVSSAPQRLITVWPVVTATLDRVQRDIRTIPAVAVAFDASARGATERKGATARAARNPGCQVTGRRRRGDEQSSQDRLQAGNDHNCPSRN
jgi:hypothetical protein